MSLNLLTVMAAQLVMRLPSAGMTDGLEHFSAMFKADLFITVASMAAFLVGSLLNSRVMISMKGRRGFCVRAILSSLVGESVDSLVFFPIAFWQVGFRGVLVLMVTQIVLKTAYEIVLLPITSRIVKAMEA